jgi:conjugative relaxase-like TrwC/TraI family protein
VMTIRRLSVGAGFRYLLKSIAVGDGPKGVEPSNLTRYYSESGTPPGIFLGAGLAGLDGGRGVAVGSVVTAEHLERMLQSCADPITGKVLGRAPAMFAPAPQGGRRPAALSGFDLTFSPSKSVSVAWALADPATREVIYRSHQEAIAYVIAYAEREVFHSRSGVGGCVEEDIVGVVAASYTHFDSRDGDPQLHDHVVVLNRAQSLTDAKWRTLDSRGLFKSAVLLSEMHQVVLSSILTDQLGWGWEAHRRQRGEFVPHRAPGAGADLTFSADARHVAEKWEVAGVAAELLAAFSQRTAALVARKDELVADFVTTTGRQPTNVEVLNLRQRATLETRHAKQGHTLTQLTTGWARRAKPFLTMAPESWVDQLSHEDLPVVHSDDFADEILADLATSALLTVAEKRPTFSRANLLSEIYRQVGGVPFATPRDAVETAQRAVVMAVSDALLLTAPELHHVPKALRRKQGHSRLRPTGHEIYTSTVLLEAEDRLLRAGRDTHAPQISTATVALVTSRRLPGRTFAPSIDQAYAIEQIATSGRRLDLLVGPAGTGKSTTMAGLRAAWEAEHGPDSVIGLAPSAGAAEVLGEEIGITTENVAKWLYEHQVGNSERHRLLEQLRERPASPATAQRIRALEDAIERWSFRRGQLIIVDEASLASTFAMDSLASLAKDVGAKLLLVGDWAQLSSVDAGGMFRTLANDRGTSAPTLSDVRRFRAEWEKKASLQMREGRTKSIETYSLHGRLSGGTREEMLDALYDAWRTDVNAGRTSLMLAGDVKTVRELNARARHDHVSAGRVSEDGVDIADDQVAGLNDTVVTRQNDRRLSLGRSWVKNGDVWTITEIHADGSLTLTRVGGDDPHHLGRSSRSVLVPATYVAANIELAYASTAHRAQGRTVDTAHAFVTATTSREILYVATTRGALSNRLYVDTHYDPDPATAYADDAPARSVKQVLEDVLANEGADVSATDAFARELDSAESLVTLAAEYNTLARMAQFEHWAAVLKNAGLSSADMGRVTASDSYGALMAGLRDADSRGAEIEDVLPRLISAREIASVEDLASVLHYRVDRYVEAAGYGLGTASNLVAGLIPRVENVDDPDLARALEERDAAMEHRAMTGAQNAVARDEEWVLALGRTPTDAAARNGWLRYVSTVAAYRERWSIDDDAPLGREPKVDASEQIAHYRRAVAAAGSARRVAEGSSAVEVVVDSSVSLDAPIIVHEL